MNFTHTATVVIPRETLVFLAANSGKEGHRINFGKERCSITRSMAALDGQTINLGPVGFRGSGYHFQGETGACWRSEWLTNIKEIEPPKPKYDVKPGQTYKGPHISVTIIQLYTHWNDPQMFVLGGLNGNKFKAYSNPSMTMEELVAFLSENKAKLVEG